MWLVGIYYRVYSVKVFGRIEFISDAAKHWGTHILWKSPFTVGYPLKNKTIQRKNLKTRPCQYSIFMLQGTAEAAYFMLQRTTTFLPVVARLTTTNVAGALSFQVGMTGKGRMQSQVFTFAPPTTKNLVAKRTINQPIFGKTGVNRISLQLLHRSACRPIHSSTW